MRTASLLFALSALAAASVHAADDQGVVSPPTVNDVPPVITEPAPTKPAQEPVNTTEPSTEPSKEPETKVPVTNPVNTTEPIETKVPITTPVNTTEPSKEPETKVPITTPVNTTEPSKEPETKEPTTTKPPINGCKILENKDRLGFDLTNVKGKIDSCQTACDNTTGCSTWTWSNFQDGTCWLKSNAGELVDAPGVSATECVRNACAILKNKDRLGFDLTSTKGKIDSCQTACDNTASCATWTWSNHQDGTCWLKSHAGDLVDAPGVSATECVRSTGCRYEPNTDWVGFDLTSARGSVDTCYKKCLDTDNCVTFSWSDHNGGTCWLKSHAGKTTYKAGVTGYTCAIEKPSNVCRVYKDIDFVGMDIGSGKAGGAHECCGLCNDFAGCTAYSWTDFNGGTCWFKKSVGHVIAKPGAVASSITPLWGPVCPFEYDVDFVGNDIGNQRAQDAGVCCSQCKANKDCKAYTWTNHNGGTCWMKSGKGETKASWGAISAALAGF